MILNLSTFNIPVAIIRFKYFSETKLLKIPKLETKSTLKHVRTIFYFWKLLDQKLVDRIKTQKHLHITKPI